ncbi:MAG: hypothetical protein CL578_00240 [Alteromonadaceae bacterium]|jgi:glycosyltransferase involved in cell wall biosynthesis|uniref:glycosyltransferase family 4 protein n=1 Tax=unclassified Methylophaga TaxID=2629249 RepID=UPI000C550B8A|nr:MULTISPECIES: glycosyltransferase family 4 protein [unclassified Methylophaga]MAP27331.1 hypothetical protein [Methylophaga sp.]MBN23467.1 hypothetical protein [Alteromonadaceae bacterium]|tara:strand:+ start:10589 stop:11614 length:1026 start_codon:yes stop_codon:yes gene_type:complete
MSKIYYLIPDLYTKKKFSLKTFLRNILDGTATKYIKRCFFTVHKPVGGIKVIYQHCLLLRELGFDAYPVLMGNYKGNFFGYNVEYKTYAEVSASVQPNDIVVATEFAPYQGLLFEKAHKVLFLQNWIGLRVRLDEDDKHKSYRDLGYDDVITCSDYCSRYVKEHMGIEAKTITNGIDLEQFKQIPTKRINNRILAMSRKNPKDLEKIIQHLHNTSYEIKVVDGLTQAELINEYQKADIFLATGYPEGFSLPPIEAMACGCVVVGFTGGGGDEFMIPDETALVAEDGDCETIIEKLHYLLTNSTEKEILRQNGFRISQSYCLANTQLSLKQFYEPIIQSKNQ